MKTKLYQKKHRRSRRRVIYLREFYNLLKTKREMRKKFWQKQKKKTDKVIKKDEQKNYEFMKSIFYARLALACLSFEFFGNQFKKTFRSYIVYLDLYKVTSFLRFTDVFTQTHIKHHKKRGYKRVIWDCQDWVRKI